MSTGAPATREDLTAPATKADLMVLKSDLKSVKTDLEGQIKDVARHLRGEMANLQASVGRTIWTAIATLGAVGILLQFFP